MEWMKSYHSKLKHPDYTILIPSNLLNPEPVYYYQNFNFESDYSGIEKDSTKPLKKKCKKWSVEKLISDFNPEDIRIQKMMKVIQETCSLNKIIAVEVDHCP